MAATTICPTCGHDLGTSISRGQRATCPRCQDKFTAGQPTAAPVAKPAPADPAGRVVWQGTAATASRASDGQGRAGGPLPAVELVVQDPAFGLSLGQVVDVLRPDLQRQVAREAKLANG